MVISQYDVFLVALDPSLGHEIRKSRPCVVISPDEMNRHVETVIIAPMTTKSHSYPTRIPVTFSRTPGWVVLDQIRTVDKRRLIKRLGRLEAKTISSIKAVIREMLVD
ncbi:MAG: type II toxin-antitoxin system PemK/MazF family toxin [Candidatus Omnitrophica bacterium]|nr:type II toxin-antitoxin system PemK/MazF family toxin [Candidatus Omnitrophota bacterium]